MTNQILQLIRHNANSRGVFLMREAKLLDTLLISSDRLATALAELERAGEIEVLNHYAFLVIRLRKWSGKGRKPASSSQSAYSYKLFNQNSMNKNSYRQDEKETLLKEILKALGESNPEAFRPAVEKYSAEVIRRALDRVSRAKGIRKNPTALFRYLLVKLSSSKP